MTTDVESANSEQTPEERGEEVANAFMGFLICAAFIFGLLIGYIAGMAT